MLQHGEVFSNENLRIVRPGDGAPPYLLDQILGKAARRCLKAGSPLSLDRR